jgi:ribosome maturation factor RimP
VYSEHFDKIIHDVVTPVLEGMGYMLVELAIGRRSGVTRVSVVLYRKEGVGIDDCARVSEILAPRLETVEGIQEVSLEVSSPGIERVLRSAREYAIFVGRGIRALIGEETEWRGGIIERVDGDTVHLRAGRETKGFALSSIRKARLDYSVEVEEAKNAV